jgi:5-methyltetrahydropteroyltriglutamate--homocysteine methyltransferase
MQRSTDRILTTHAGSIPRGEPLGSMLIDQEQGKSIDQAKLSETIEARVAHVIGKQAEVGIDSANDGEQGRVGFQTYIPQRMEGFGGVSKRPYGKEFIEFSQFTERMLARIPKTGKVFDAPQAIAELKYHGGDALDAEIDRFKRVARPMGSRFRELFMNAPSPGIVATTMLNAYYKSQQDYLEAIARELRIEYAKVVEAGFVLQIDAPDLAMERVLLYQDMSDQEFAKVVEQHVAALNQALRGVPPDRVRRTNTTLPWTSSCRRFTRPTSARSGSSLPIRGASMRPQRCVGISCRTTWRSSPASSIRRATSLSTRRWLRSASRQSSAQSGIGSASLPALTADSERSWAGNG